MIPVRKNEKAFKLVVQGRGASSHSLTIALGTFLDSLDVRKLYFLFSPSLGTRVLPDNKKGTASGYLLI